MNVLNGRDDDRTTDAEVSRRGVPGIRSVAFLALLSACLYAPELLGRRAFFFFDVSSLNLPARDWAFRQIRAGYFPQWQPHWACGFPFVAESQSGIYYPPNYLCYLLTPAWYAVALAYTVHCWWTGIGALYYFRRFTAPPGALFGAMVFCLGGRMLSHQIHAGVVDCIAWFPWVLLGIDRFVVDGRRRALLWASLAVGLQGLAGSLQMTACCHVGYAVFLAGSAVHPTHRRRAAMALIGLSVALAGLSAPLWLPAAELLQRSSRATGLSSESAGYGAVFPHRWTSIMAPGLFGHPAFQTAWLDDREPIYEMPLYHGAALVPLAFVGFWIGRRRREVFLLLLLTVCGLSLAMGEANLLGFWMRKLPILGSIRVPARFLLFAGFGLCGLAAIGWNAVWYERRGRMLLLASSLAGSAAVAALFHYLYRDYLLHGPHMGLLAERNLIDTWWETLVPAVVILWATTLGVWLPGRWPSRFFFLMAALELGLQCRLAYPTIEPNFHAEPAVVPEIRRHSGAEPPRVFAEWRVNSMQRININRQGWRRSLDPFRKISGCLYYERGPLFDIGLVVDQGKLPMETRRWEEFRRLANVDARFFELTGLSLRLTPRRTVGDILFASPGCFLESTGVRTALAYFCPRSIRVTADQSLATVLRPQTSPYECVVLESPTGETLSPDQKRGTESLKVVQKTAADKFWPATSQWEGPNRLRIAAEAPTDGFIVVNIMDYPGWSATVDGRPAKIETANSVFMAVSVTAGPRTIELEFRSATVYWGQCIGVGSLLVWAAVFSASQQRPFRGSGLEITPASFAKPAAIAAMGFVVLLLCSAWILADRYQGAFPSLESEITKVLADPNH